tara:strand:- start:8972 stop:9322 length:351 start_codon:yes stop_codon:yes gene_type:complete
MKKLLILLCLATLVSCGIKDKFLNSSTGGLGVPKQPSEVVVLDDNGTTQNSDGLPTEIAGHKVTYSDMNTTTDDASEASPDEVETSFNWYYLILVGILLIVAFLVYRLKKQNMISE